MSLRSEAKLVVNFIKEGKQVVAYSPALDISTVGKDEAQAKRRFEELLHIFIKDITERNVVDDVLTELGWTKGAVHTKNTRPQWIPPVVKSIDLQVPIMA